LLSLLRDRAGTSALAMANLRINVGDLCNELRRRLGAAGATIAQQPVPVAQLVPGTRRVIAYGRGTIVSLEKFKAILASPAFVTPLILFLLAMALGAWLLR